MARILSLALTVGLASLFGDVAAQEAQFKSHPPMRPLPAASHRPLAAGSQRFVDPAKGDDAAAGTEPAPWRTLTHATRQLNPGDTLYLRGGVYWERVALTKSGTTEGPITIAGYPGELAVLDGGLREFFESPATSWEL